MATGENEAWRHEYIVPHLHLYSVISQIPFIAARGELLDLGFLLEL